MFEKISGGASEAVVTVDSEECPALVLGWYRTSHDDTGDAWLACCLYYRGDRVFSELVPADCVLKIDN